ncbi:MAG: lipid-binding SYLF domain-containing protein [Gammaproteobacteria bacterium]|nr:lipid-binding SYLF domain-containing protein [Gammaproteobacteria bacterium]
MRKNALLAVTALMFSLSAHAADPTKTETLVGSANKTLRTFLAEENLEWFKNHLRDAWGVMIIPKMITAGFVVAGSGGEALLLARDAETGKWSDPAFYRVGGFSVGLQAGGQTAEVILLVRSDRALRSLMRTRGKFSAAGSIAVGPVGGGVESNVTAELVSFTRAKGAFAGVSLGGSAVEPNAEFNGQYYGRK